MTTNREWFEKDYYKVLGVDSKASQKDITKAYRQLARDNHPDANPGDDAAEERFKEVSAAYDVVGDSEKRAEYEKVRKLGPLGGAFGGGGGGGGPAGAGGFNFDPNDLGDLGDIGDLLGGLGGLFGRGGPGGRQRTGPSRGTGPQRGSDVETELHLSFTDAVKGVTAAVNLTSDARCSACGGSGAKAGTKPRPCSDCSGRGVRSEDQGFFSFSQPCTPCAGRGSIIDSPCPTCRSTGVERRPHQVKVRIPAGVKDKQRIRVKGRGSSGANGGPAGDLYVVVRVASHDLFGRKGADLTLRVPITYPEAALGAKVSVPTLDGKPVTLRVPAGTKSGRTFRVKGGGVALDAKTGDLLVTVDVAVPTNLSDDERSAIEALADKMDSSPREHLGVDG